MSAFRFGRQSLRAKLLAVLMATTCLSLGVAGLALSLFEVRNHRATLQHDLATVADIVSKNSTANITFEDQDAARDTLGALVLQPDVQLGCLYGGNGHLFASFRRARPERAPEACAAAAGADGVLFGGSAVSLTRPVILSGKRIGTLQVVASLDEIKRRMQLFAGVLLGILTAAALIGLLLSSRLERVVSEPVRELASTARLISQHHDYTLRAPKRTEDEVGVAVEAFNDMLERIEDANSALRTARDESRDQAALLQSILDSMGEGLLVVDAEGHVLLWNPAATRLVGPGPADLEQGVQDWVSRFELLGETGETPIGPDDFPIGRATRGEAVRDWQVRVRPPDAAHWLWLNVSAQPLRDHAGVLRGGLAVFRDVTERRRAEETLRTLNATLEQRVAERTAAAEQRATQLKRSNEELERFAYVASHDLQEPLRAVASYTQLIDHALAGSQSGDVALYISHVLAGVTRMRALITDLLQYSQVGRQLMAPEPTDLDAALDAALVDLQPGLTEAGAVVTRAPLPVVQAAPGPLMQVLRNLVGNALKFRGDAPPVIDVSATREGRFWTIAVHDNGVGIEARHHERVFVIFQRLHGRERPGTGIGLAICRRIVERFGGRIWVESEPGHGATFLFCLPAAEASEKPKD